MNIFKFQNKTYLSDKDLPINELVCKIWNKHSMVPKKPSEIKIEKSDNDTIEFYLYTSFVGFPIIDPLHFGIKYKIEKIKYEMI